MYMAVRSDTPAVQSDTPFSHTPAVHVPASGDPRTDVYTRDAGLGRARSSTMGGAKRHARWEVASRRRRSCAGRRAVRSDTQAVRSDTPLPSGVPNKGKGGRQQ